MWDALERFCSYYCRYQKQGYPLASGMNYLEYSEPLLEGLSIVQIEASRQLRGGSLALQCQTASNFFEPF